MCLFLSQVWPTLCRVWVDRKMRQGTPLEKSWWDFPQEREHPLGKHVPPGEGNTANLSLAIYGVCLESTLSHVLSLLRTLLKLSLQTAYILPTYICLCCNEPVICCLHVSESGWSQPSLHPLHTHCMAHGHMVVVDDSPKGLYWPKGSDRCVFK